MTKSVKTTSIRLFIQVIVLSFMLTLSLLGGYHLFMQQKGVSKAMPASLSDFHQTQSEFESNMSKNLHKMLAQIVGANAIKVNIHADIDFEEQQITREFLDASDPVRTTQSDSFYGFSKQTTLSSSQGGRIKRLSVAVLLDSTHKNYTDQDKDNIRSLVYSTVGFDASRGDSVDIQTMPFVQPSFWQKSSTQTIGIFLAIVLLVGVLGVLWIKSMALSAHVSALPPIKQPDYAVPPTAISMVNSPVQINGKVPQNLLNNAQKIVRAKPNEALNTLRSWLCQEDENVL